MMKKTFASLGSVLLLVLLGVISCTPASAMGQSEGIPEVDQPIAVQSETAPAPAPAPAELADDVMADTSESHKDNSGDFDDNTQGYCDLKKKGILAVDDLMETSEDLLLSTWFDLWVDEFGDTYYYVTKDLERYVRLAREFITFDDSLITDFEILNALTIKEVTGEPHTLSRECLTALTDSICDTIASWFGLMGVGSLNGAALLEEESAYSEEGTEVIAGENSTRKLGHTFQQSSNNAQRERELVRRSINNVLDLYPSLAPKFLQIFSSTAPTFDKFIDTIFLNNDGLTVKSVMDNDFTNAVGTIGSWFEAAATAPQFTSKYAAFAVTDGLELLEDFVLGSGDVIFAPRYAAAVATCNMVTPTGPPVTAGPGATPSPTADTLAIQEKFIPNIAIVDSGGPSQAALLASWLSFKATWPDRKFCVLRLRNGGDVMIPAVMEADANVIFESVNQDNGDPFLRSNWFDICQLYDVGADGTSDIGVVTAVAVLLGVDVSLVQASYNLFVSSLNVQSLELKSATVRGDDNWIQPMNTFFFESASTSFAPSGSFAPSAMPSLSPSKKPTMSPSIMPSRNPSSHPSDQPSMNPSVSNAPSSQPSSQPTGQPSSLPSSNPSVSKSPSTQPSKQPSNQPSMKPSVSMVPSTSPSKEPSMSPSVDPSGEPSLSPSKMPSSGPSGIPTMQPSLSFAPSGMPSSIPSNQPSEDPSSQPSEVPSSQPSSQPSEDPSSQPSEVPSSQPSSQPPIVEVLVKTPVPTPAPVLATPAPVPVPVVTASAYTIDLRIQGASASSTAAVTAARDKIQSIVMGDLPSAPSGRVTTMCGTDPADIDDMNICTRFRDLSGSVIGLGGPRLVRINVAGTLLPITGEISIDTSLQGNTRRITSTAQHEMLHAMGVGTLWDEYGLTSSGGSCAYSANTNANRQFQALSGCSFPVPVNPGDCSHWSRDCFGGAELMGPVESTLAGLSSITIGSLEDLGYKVDYGKADTVSPNFFGSQCQCNRRLDESNNMTASEQYVPRRQLSEAGQAEAEAFGLAVLSENQEFIDSTQGLLPDTDVMDIGGHVVSVMYEEDGVAWDVVVRSGTLNLRR